MRRILLAALAAGVLLTPPVSARRVPVEFRGLWVDTFNTPLNNHADVLRLVRSAEDARMNVILAQVRRRGDAWYVDAQEPPPDFTPIEPGFDPLADLIATAHAAAIEVHAFVIVGALWNKDPAGVAPANGLPLDPRHVFNRHGGYDPARRQIVPGPATWLTRTLLPDGSGISYQGHRIGSEFWIDLGHPDAAAYTADVIERLVRRYDLDGIHLDRIRYPELSAAGQSPTAGANIGYNAVSVARFNRHHDLPVDAVPASGDARWAEWRRLQVTQLVRRVYLSATAIRPRITVSAALIAFGGGPANDTAWRSSEAYWRVYQDWRGWLEEGILDLGIVMNYKREHDATQARQFDEWTTFLAGRQYRRAAIAGVGSFLNGVEGSLRQTRRAVAAAPGVAYFSFATPSDAVTNNPFSWPPGQTTPRRPFSDFAAALTSGRSGSTLFENPTQPQPPPFAEAAFVARPVWKDTPRHGHLSGLARLPDGTVLDTERVLIVHTHSRRAREVLTDGNGFFGAVDLDPGDYAVVARAGGLRWTGLATVRAGRVAEVRLTPERGSGVSDGDRTRDSRIHNPELYH